MSTLPETEDMNNYISMLTVAAKRIILLGISVAVIFSIYWFLVPLVWRNTPTLVALVVVWFLTAYIALPHLHRFVTKIYFHDYFIMRTSRVEGLLGDPINLAIRGSRKDLINTMEAAGLHLAEPATLNNIMKILKAIVTKESYPKAPVSNLYLFGRKQDLAFQVEIDNNPRQRHHIRLWKTPKKWYMPGGLQTDWLGAATYDKTIGFSTLTGQLMHKIDANIDHERDFFVKQLKKSGLVRKVEKIRHYMPPFKARGGGGDYIVSDGSMVIVTLKKGQK